MAKRRRRSCPTSDLPPVYTIGHSTRTIPDFVDLLRAGGVRLVIDVRTIPRSRTNPQYNSDVLGTELEPWQVAYGRIAELGGLRGRAHEVAPDINGFWENQSFHNYADYALTSTDFPMGLERLEELAGEQPTAVMCSEAVWWRCHRRIIADYLLARGRPVFHLMGKDRVEPARMTAGAREQDGRVAYPGDRSDTRSPSGV